MTTHENGSGSDRVHALVSQREQLRAWIARLDEVQTGAPSRVTERVRADYQDRLRRVTEELSDHGEEIQRNLQALRDQLAAAEERRNQAADALEETRLRHLIGELDEPAWDQARAPLEQDVAAAEQAVSTTRAEVEHLSTLATEIVGPEPQPDTAPEPAFDGATTAVAEDAGEDEDVGGDLPFFGADDAAAPAEAGAADTAGADEDAGGWEPELELAGEPAATAEDVRAATADAGVSGEELAAWISEVEAETTGGEDAAPAAAEPEPAAAAGENTPPTAEDVEGWDPFANEFGGSPANPTTQPGDAAQDLPWLDSLQGGAAGKWSQPADGGADDLAFLDNLDAPAAPAAGAAPAADLAADDLAFLEELDRAISGGAQRPGQPAAPAGQGGLGDEFQGGSGGGIVGPTAESTQEQPRKRGEALLCKECGAINEPQAWYCEICGSEL